MPIESFVQRQTPYWLNFVFVGQAYKLFHRQEIPATSIGYIQVDVPAFPENNLIHILDRSHEFQLGGPWIIRIIEDATFTSGTTPIIPVNLDRRSVKTSSITAFSDPTGVSGGIIIDEVFLPSGGSVGQRAGGIVPQEFERVLKPNATTIVEIENLGSQEGTMHSNIFFYESSN